LLFVIIKNSAKYGLKYLANVRESVILQRKCCGR